MIESLEDLRAKRNVLNEAIQAETTQKTRLEHELVEINDQLKRVREYLAKKVGARNAYDASIAEAESSYVKILESSHTLLHVLKRESINLSKKAAE